MNKYNQLLNAAAPVSPTFLTVKPLMYGTMLTRMQYTIDLMSTPTSKLSIAQSILLEKLSGDHNAYRIVRE